MKNELIEILIRAKILRIRQRDPEKIKAMIKSAEMNAEIAENVPLDERSATLIFREIYESVRQLGDARWWLLGYEPSNHEVSLDILKEMEIKDKLKLNFLDRFKNIRHDANYRGFIVLVSQASEIIEFWNKCGKEIAQILLKELK